MEKYIKIFIFSLLYCAAYAQELNYGLEFSSFEVTQDKRTSLNLTPEKPLEFDGGFTLSFDIYYPFIQQLDYGYVFRLLGQNGQHIDFLVNLEKLQVINSESKILAYCLLSKIPDSKNSFFNFTLSLDIRKNNLQVFIADNMFGPEAGDLKDFKKINLLFGKSDYSNLQTSDVPKIVLKDIRIDDYERKPLYHWKLFKHTENGLTYDELQKIPAKTENPKWLVDEHAFWKKRVSLQTRINPQIAFDFNNNMVAVADSTIFKLYNTKTYSIQKSLNVKGALHSQSANQIIYNPLDNRCYSYCFDTIDGNHVAGFDTTNSRWENNEFKEIDIEFWHHNRFISQKDSCLYLFCGYGHHRYKNAVNKYSFGKKQWEYLQFSDDKISPRYLSGLGVIDDEHILIFGGFGSETGLQELAPHNYYDLYTVNLLTMESEKVWELPPQKENFAVANSLIVDTVERCFYALCFPQYLFNSRLFLAKFSLDKPEFKVVSDSIPFQFRDITSYADLFLNKETKELTAVTFHSATGDTQATVSFFSLAYPPVATNDIFQNVHDGKSYWLPVIIMTVLILLLLMIYCFYFRKKGKNDFLPYEEPVTAKQVEQQKDKHSEVLLFGGFHIRNEGGDDFAGEFSPLLKQLFLTVLLYTLKEDTKGISSTRLKDMLWFDKSAESAKNNRNVMLSKIRQIFENIGAISIERKNSQWSMTFGDEIYCDYKEAMSIMRRLKPSGENSKNMIIRLIKIISAGELLPDIQTEWFDSFKADFVNNLIDCLLSCSSKYEFSFQEQVAIADAILIHDVLNENAIKLKCTSLVKTGKNGLAKTVYDSFAKEYKKMLGVEFGLCFNEIVS